MLCIQELRKHRKLNKVQVRNTFTFLGPPENYIREAPAMNHNDKPWSLCVSAKWQREFDGEELTFKETDNEHSVLRLDVPDDLFDAESMAWSRIIEEEGADIPIVANTV